jgi:hypothetical protein
VDAVAATIGDAAQLLDVDVDQLAGSGALIAEDHPTRGPVQHRQPTQAVADKDAVHGGGGSADPGADPGRAELVGAAQPADLGLHADRHPAGVMVGVSGPILQASLTVLLVAGPPTVGTGPGDAHLSGDMGGRSASGVRGQGLMSFPVRAHMSVAGQAGSLQGTTSI